MSRLLGFCVSLVLIVVVINHPAFAHDKKGHYAVLGHGTESCGTFIEAANEGQYQNNWKKWNGFYFWTVGYLSGYNRYVEGLHNIIANTDMRGCMAFVEQYCRDNPLKDYDSAVNALIKEIEKSRNGES